MRAARAEGTIDTMSSVPTAMRRSAFSGHDLQGR